MSAQASLRIAVADRRWLPAATIVFGSAALVARTVSLTSMAPTALAGVAGLLPVLAPGQRVSWRRRALVTAGGMAVFAVARFAGHAPGVRVTHAGMIGLMIAAVAEEIFFRRFVYGTVERFGAAAAIVTTSLMFAFIHLPMYGMRAMPIDVAAGALLGWQRWASGTWVSPAITHAFANLVMMG